MKRPTRKKSLAARVYVGELMLLQHRVQIVRQAHAKTTDELFELEQRVHSLIERHKPKENPT